MKDVKNNHNPYFSPHPITTVFTVTGAHASLSHAFTFSSVTLGDTFSQTTAWYWFSHATSAPDMREKSISFFWIGMCVR